MVEVFVYFSYSVSYYIRDPIFRIVLVLCIERLHDICCRTLMFFDDNFLEEGRYCQLFEVISRKFSESKHPDTSKKGNITDQYNLASVKRF